jgi:hypothetical protein
VPFTTATHCVPDGQHAQSEQDTAFGSGQHPTPLIEKPLPMHVEPTGQPVVFQDE